ncbi:hypothetical protein [Prosthecobacter sp.]|uniref:hypothetical protein n=1 Tax=Prosthecobacter sp. TaxID=1965333 RepID=UPI001DE69D00|nr:hypothetical protein [Prosthecobacter sp.]MCB1275828.1 hypothetical protein [Prosthecobacter sp.]
MNTQHWINHFEANTRLNHELRLPETPCELPDQTREAFARSIAIFQLGESGGGTRLRRYTRSIASLENLKGYQRAVDLFVAEEQSHAALLARTVGHLRGTLLKKQWTNSIFRWMRDLVNLEFNIQVLLTAELIAEVYFGLLSLRCSDPVVQTVAKKLLRDEMGHLSFQRDFLFERLKTLIPAMQRLWRWQFQAIHFVTAAVVAWDHRDCLRALNVSPADFRARAVRCWQSFQSRLERRLGESETHARQELASTSGYNRSSSAAMQSPVS